MRRRVAIALVLLALPLAGCIRYRTTPPRAAPEPAPRVRAASTSTSASPTPAPAAVAERPAAPPRDAVRFDEVVQTFGLEVELDLATGRRRCHDAVNEVVVVPGETSVEVNGVTHDLLDRIAWHQGVLYLPGRARGVLAAHLRLPPPPELADIRPRRVVAPRPQPAAPQPASAPRAVALPDGWNQNARREWQYIVIHHSATSAGGAQSFHREHARKWENGLGYHFVVGNGTHTGVGEVEVGTRWLRQNQGIHGAHAGNRLYNEHGIGICLVGDFSHQAPSAQQLEALRGLCRALMQRYGIPKANVKPHSDVRARGTECPGDSFPWREFVRGL